MSTVYVNSISDLINNWNGGVGFGNGKFLIEQNLIIRASESSSFPLLYSDVNIAGVNVDGVLQSAPYVITIDIGNNDWYGLFKFGQGAQFLRISNVQVIIKSAKLQDFNSALLAYNSDTNPEVDIINVQVSVTPLYENDIVYANSWGGFVCGINTHVLGSAIYINNCIYSGYISENGGGFIATGYTEGATGYATLIKMSGCYADITNISSATQPLLNNGGGLCGNKMQFHQTEIKKCIVNLTNLENTTSVGGFFADLAYNFVVRDSYVVITDDSHSCTVGFIASSLESTGRSVTDTRVSDSYFVTMTDFPRQTLYNYIHGDVSGSARLFVYSCAFQNGTIINPMFTGSTSVIVNYTYTTDTSNAPFIDWDPTVWTTSTVNNTPLLLQEFTTIPFQNYVEANDIPTLTDLCIFEGTKLLTTEGYILVENLRKDHVLCTWNGHTTKIQTIYMFRNSSMPCYKISKDALAPNIPHDDVYLSGGHAIYTQKNEFIHPFHFRNRFTHTKGRMWNKSRYYCIETEDYYKDVLIASGMPIEGFGGNDPKSHTWKCQENSQCQMVLI